MTPGTVQTMPSVHLEAADSTTVRAVVFEGS